MDDPVRSRRCRNLCLVVGLPVLLIAILLVILGLTVFKPKRQVTTIDSITLEDFKFSLSLIPQINVHINLTLATGVSIRNPNRLGMKYANSSVSVDYRGELIAEAPIPAGSVSGRETIGLNLTLTVMVDRLVSNSEFLGDVVRNGTIPLTAYTRISGKVRVLFFKIHVVTSTTCNFVVSVAGRNITYNDCVYRMKW